MRTYYYICKCIHINKCVNAYILYAELGSATSLCSAATLAATMAKIIENL